MVHNTNHELFGSERSKVVVCIVLLLAFLSMTLLRTGFYSVDIQVNSWIPPVQTPVSTLIAIGIAFVFDTTSLVLISLAIASLLFAKVIRTANKKSVANMLSAI